MVEFSDDNVTIIRVPFDADLKCPVCEDNIPIMTVVGISGGSARKAGSSGFRNPILATNIESNIRGIEISHECTYKKAAN